MKKNKKNNRPRSFESSNFDLDLVQSLGLPGAATLRTCVHAASPHRGFMSTLHPRLRRRHFVSSSLRVSDSNESEIVRSSHLRSSLPRCPTPCLLRPRCLSWPSLPRASYHASHRANRSTILVTAQRPPAQLEFSNEILTFRKT